MREWQMGHERYVEYSPEEMNLKVWGSVWVGWTIGG